MPQLVHFKMVILLCKFHLSKNKKIVLNHEIEFKHILL